jgi:predicted peptidase
MIQFRVWRCPLRILWKGLASVFGFAVFAALLAVPSACAKKVQTGFLDRNIAVAGTEYKYQVFVPDNWTPKKIWPVILFLHGAGERGDDGLAQTEVGIGRAIRLDRGRVAAIVVMPQCRKEMWWTQSPMDAVAIAALDAATKEFHGDTARTYLTGLSMGGYGTWYLASKFPGKFAALAPICGGITLPEHLRQQHPELEKASLPDDPKSFSDTAAKIAKTPVWIFHGGADPVVPVTESRRMNDALKAAGGEVRYIEYPGVGHNSWDNAYAEAELFPWMFSKATNVKSKK